MKALLFALSAVFFLLTMRPALEAQDARGRVIGVVTDPSGAVVPGVRITVTNAETGIGRDTMTDVDGAYQVLLLPIGRYQVKAEARGFRTIVTDPQALDINQALRVDIKLEVGQPTETVQVETASSTVETVSATLGQAVTGTQIQNAPLNGRNVLDLALFAPGRFPTFKPLVQPSVRPTLPSVSASPANAGTR